VRCIEKNIIGYKRYEQYHQLSEEKWQKVDGPFLKDIGLNEKEAYILFTIIDSFQIKTDVNRSSSLILGEFFDIGLQFFRIRNNRVEDTVFVPDIVMLSRHRDYINLNTGFNDRDVESIDFCVKQQKYDQTWIYYDVWLIPKAKEVIVAYIKEFPNIIDYLRQTNVRNELIAGDSYRKYHTVYELYRLDERPDDDPNINLFKVYSWLLKSEISSLKLYSGLSLNASRNKIGMVIDYNEKE